jgi:hypothetical protein
MSTEKKQNNRSSALGSLQTGRSVNTLKKTLGLVDIRDQGEHAGS